MSDQEGIDHLGGTVFSGGTFFLPLCELCLQSLLSAMPLTVP